jgi:hypothetical protein
MTQTLAVVSTTLALTAYIALTVFTLLRKDGIPWRVFQVVCVGETARTACSVWIASGDWHAPQFIAILFHSIAQILAAAAILVLAAFMIKDTDAKSSA